MWSTSPLFSLPLELREDIYNLVLAGGPGEIRLKLCDKHGDRLTFKETESKCGNGVLRVPKWNSASFSGVPPLLLTSRMLYQEMKRKYEVNLLVQRNVVFEAIEDDYGGVHVQDFVSNDRYLIKHRTEQLRNAVGEDDFRFLLGDLLRKSVRKITLFSALGLDGMVICKSQFPNLELVYVKNLAKKDELVDDFGHKVKEFQLAIDNDPIPYTLNADEHPLHVKRGKIDALLVERARKKAENFTLRRLPHGSQRGYRIHVEFDVKVGSNVAHPVYGGAEMKLAFDYDTNEVIRRWNWRLNETWWDIEPQPSSWNLPCELAPEPTVPDWVTRPRTQEELPEHLHRILEEDDAQEAAEEFDRLAASTQ